MRPRRSVAQRCVWLAAAAVVVPAVVAVAPVGAHAAAPSSPGDWPELGHDVGSSFHNQDAGVTPTTARHLSVLWRWNAPGSVNGTAAVVGGRVYTVSEGGTAALDERTGRVRWIDPSVNGTSSPTVSDGMVYVLDGSAVLHALDAASGREEWKARLDDQQYASGFSSPVVWNGLVIVGVASVAEVASSATVSFRGSVVAVDRSSGTVTWRHVTADPPSNGVGVWSSVSIDPATDTVFVSTGNNYTTEGPPPPTRSSRLTRKPACRGGHTR